MLDAKKILYDNYNDFAQEIGAYNIPTVQDLERRYVTPSDDDMSVMLLNALTDTCDKAFEVGFNAAIRFLACCVMERR